MPITESGRAHITRRLARLADADAGPAQANAEASAPAACFDADSVYLAVGASSAPFEARQTDLQAGENRCLKGLDPDGLERQGEVLTFRATFGPEEANFEWREWGVFSARAGGVMLCRKPARLGRKRPGETWRLEVALSLDGE